MTYIPTGPWNNGAGPGVSAGFLGNVETWIETVDAPISNNVVGTTSGSAQLYQFLNGTVKAFFLYFNGYRNSTTSEQIITFPTAFTTYAGFVAFGGVPQAHILTSGTRINGKILDWAGFPVGSGAGSTNTGLNQINGYSAGDIQSGFNQIGLGVSQGSSFTCGLLIIGI